MKKVLVLMMMAGTLLYACQQSTKTESETAADSAAVEAPVVEEMAPADSAVVTDSAEVSSDSIQ